MSEEKGRGCFFYGCITAAVLGSLFIALIAGIYFYGRSEVGPYCDAYLALVKDQKYEEAYGTIAPAWQSAQTLEQYTEFESTVRDHIGELQEKSLTNVNIQSNTGGTFARIVYSAKYSKSPNVVLTFALVKSGSEWMVQGLHYGSPELAKPKICSKCGKGSNLLVKFCPGCGTALDGADEETK